MVAATVSVARGDSLTLRLEPSVQATDTSVRDASGATQTGETRQYAGLYQLSLQKTLYESLLLSGTGTLQDTRGTTSSGGISTDVDAQTWVGDAALTFGQDVLAGGIGYSRNETSSSTRTSTDPFALVQPSIVRETWSASARWRPLELPSLEGRVARDTTRSANLDQTAISAALSSAYRPSEQLRLSASLTYSDGTDNLADVETASLSQSATATYNDTFFRRTSVFAHGQISHTSTSIRAGPTSGPVRTPRPPVEGLSLVEGFTDAPDRDALRTNALVIDGDLGTSAGLNIGFGPTLAGDQALRDVGVRFVEREPVNLIEVWVDERLPLGVSSAYVWSAYSSIDNLTWSEVTISGEVLFHPVENRFDVPIVSTVAPYLKVVTRPISTAVSPDPRFRDVGITEVRAFFVQSAADVRGRRSAVGATFSGAAGTRILDKPSLRHDLALSLSTTEWEKPNWQLSNGLSLAHRLGKATALSASVLRSDGENEEGHVWRIQYGANLTTSLLPTLATGASFGGFLAPEGARGNGASVFARAALYRGVDVTANGGYSLTTAPDDRTTEGVSASASATVVPLRWATLGGHAVTSWSSSSGGGAPDATSRATRLDATLAVNPLPAVYLSAGVARAFGTITPTTLYNFSATYSPFREGALLLSVAHSQNFETTTETRNRMSTASARWNFAPVAYVEASYALLDTKTLQTATEAQSIAARLAVTL